MFLARRPLVVSWPLCCFIFLTLWSGLKEDTWVVERISNYPSNSSGNKKRAQKLTCPGHDNFFWAAGKNRPHLPNALNIHRFWSGELLPVGKGILAAATKTVSYGYDLCWARGEEGAKTSSFRPNPARSYPSSIWQEGGVILLQGLRADMERNLEASSID